MKSKEKLTIFLTISILGILIFIFNLWLVTGTLKVKAAWYNMDWLYRRQIIVNGDGSSYTNLNVLITIDTALLITNNKLQQDCDDIRFTDSDGITEINYWIEGACNSTVTQIWVKIPTMTTTDKTIYIYYGNSNANSNQMAWNGNFILLSDSTCQNGWIQNSSFNNKFPYGSTSYGTTGGAGNHNHNGSITVTTGTPNSTTNARDYGTGGGVAATGNHTHTATVSIGSTTTSPSYLSMIFCSKAELSSINNLIALFDSSTLPSGNWQRFTAIDSRLPIGSNSYGTTGGSSTHTHTVSSGTTSNQSAMVSVNYGNGDWNPKNVNARYDHTHSFSASLSTNNHMPPYLTMIFAKHNNSEDYNFSSIITMATGTPPLGWDYFSPLNEKFPLGGSSYGGTGGSTTHTHTITVSTGSASTSRTIDGGSGSVSVGNHSQNSNSTSLSSNSNIPPYLSVLFIKRKLSPSSSILSEEMKNFPPATPTNLLVNNILNNKNVDNSSVIYFSAKFSDPDESDNGIYYEIHVNSSPNFDGTVKWNSGKTTITPISNNSQSSNITYNGSSLESGTQYYWRIRFWDNNDAVSNWSETANFITKRQPSPPTLLLVDNQTNPTYLSSPTPSFSAVYNDINEHNAIYYQIQVNTNNLFNGDTVWDTGKQTTSINNGQRSPDYIYSGAPLIDSGNIYYWRIRFWDIDNQTGDWSQPGTFTDKFNHQYYNGIQMEGLRLY